MHVHVYTRFISIILNVYLVHSNHGILTCYCTWANLTKMMLALNCNIHWSLYFVLLFFSEGSTYPNHWYRMKAFDEAADFGELTRMSVMLLAPEVYKKAESVAKF